MTAKHEYIALPSVLEHDSWYDYVLERKVCAHCGETKYKRIPLQESGYESHGTWKRESDDS